MKQLGMFEDLYPPRAGHCHRCGKHTIEDENPFRLCSECQTDAGKGRGRSRWLPEAERPSWVLKGIPK